MDKNVEDNATTVLQNLIKEALMTSAEPLEMSLHFFSLRTIIDIKARQGFGISSIQNSRICNPLSYGIVASF